MENNKYVLAEDEYEAVEKILRKSHLDATLIIAQKLCKHGPFPGDAYDYFIDLNSELDLRDNEISLVDGLQIIYEGAIDYKESYGLSDAEIETFRQLLIKFEIINDQIKLY